MGTRIGRRRAALAAVVAAAAVALAPALVMGQSATQFRATLSGANEVPAVTTTATGTFTATLDAGGQTLTWSLSTTGVGSLTAAHIHTGAAGTNGAIVVNLVNLALPASNVNSTGTARPNDLVGPLAGNWAGFVQALTAGTLYVNVHNTPNPGGVIHAQLVQATATPTATVAASTQATATATATVRPATATAAPAATVVATAAPAVPRTGNAGLATGQTGAAVVALLVLIAIAGVAGGRLLTARRR